MKNLIGTTTTTMVRKLPDRQSLGNYKNLIMRNVNHNLLENK